MGLALQPDIVRNERLETGKLRPPVLPYSNAVGSLKLGVPLSFDEITENGALGDAHQASEEFGNELAEAVVQRSVEFLDSFLGEQWTKTEN